MGHVLDALEVFLSVCSFWLWHGMLGILKEPQVADSPENQKIAGYHPYSIRVYAHLETPCPL